MRYFFEICYNGSRYSGWQCQKNAISIQAVVEDSLSKLLREETEVTASGRTDAGVHCEQQFFHCDIHDILPENFLFRLNSILPADIAIKSIHQVPDDAHARYSALERSYIYRITREKDPFKNGYAFYFFRDLDIQTMNEAAALLVGTRNFECFSKVKTDVSNFTCEVRKAGWFDHGTELEFHISANRFLRGMVRAIVGTLLDVGQQRTSVEDVEAILLSRDRREAGANVPAHGLYLTSVLYPQDIFIKRIFTNSTTSGQRTGK